MISAASQAPGAKPKAYRNYQELLADKDIDAVLIATAEHWHARMVLDALASGKAIYSRFLQVRHAGAEYHFSQPPEFKRGE